MRTFKALYSSPIINVGTDDVMCIRPHTSQICMKNCDLFLSLSAKWSFSSMLYIIYLHHNLCNSIPLIVQKCIKLLVQNVPSIRFGVCTKLFLKLVKCLAYVTYNCTFTVCTCRGCSIFRKLICFILTDHLLHE